MDKEKKKDIIKSVVVFLLISLIIVIVLIAIGLSLNIYFIERSRPYSLKYDSFEAFETDLKEKVNIKDDKSIYIFAVADLGDLKYIYTHSTKKGGVIRKPHYNFRSYVMRYNYVYPNGEESYFDVFGSLEYSIESVLEWEHTEFIGNYYIDGIECYLCSRLHKDTEAYAFFELDEVYYEITMPNEIGLTEEEMLSLLKTIISKRYKV